MHVISLEINNILSIESASLSFEDNGLILVEGWNYDTGRANGAGKTAIFNCLSFALYDKLPRKITASEILKRGHKSGHVRCSVQCGKDIWSVQRSRPKGVKFFKNNLEQDISQFEFESAIRLSYDQFLLTVYTAQANSGQSSRFLISPDADKKAFLLRLLNLEQFNDCKKAFDEAVKSSSNTAAELNSKLNSIKSKIEAYQESLIDEEETKSTLLALEESIAPLNKQLIEYSSVSKPDLSKYSKLEDDARAKQSNIIQTKMKRTMLYDKYRDFSNMLRDYDSDVACGECGSSLDSEEGRLKHAQHQAQAKNKMADLKSQLDECDVITAKEQDINNLLRKIRDKKAQDSVDYHKASEAAAEIKSLITLKNNKIETLTSQISNNNELLNKVSLLKTALLKGASSVSDLKDEIEILKTLSSMYSPTGAQAYILDSVVDAFNEYVQRHIDTIWPHASYQLNSYKETAKGDVVAKFSETLVLDGQEVSVGSLSGGEQKALSLCVDFALLDVLEGQFGLSLNPIILDEPFDGLDSVGREIVMELLEKLSKSHQILVIDHTSETKALFSKTIRVEKKSGTSVINVEL